MNLEINISVLNNQQLIDEVFSCVTFYFLLLSLVLNAFHNDYAKQSNVLKI